MKIDLVLVIFPRTLSMSSMLLGLTQRLTDYFIVFYARK